MKQTNCGDGAGRTLPDTWRGNDEDTSSGPLGIAVTLSGGNSIDSLVTADVAQGAAAVLTVGTANIRESHSPMALKAASLSIAPQAI